MRTSEGRRDKGQLKCNRNYRKHQQFMNSDVAYPTFPWAELGSQEYIDAIERVNGAYRDMVAIGKGPQKFRDKITPMLTAKSKQEFMTAHKSLRRTYNDHLKKKKASLERFNVETEFYPDFRKYGRSEDQKLPTNRDVIAKERILTFEQYMASLNVFKCSVCLECRIETKDTTDDLIHRCSSCEKRKDDNYYIDNNLHPVWYLINDDGNYVRDDNGNKIPQYHIPEELSCLTMCEKLLIRRCANFVPSVHLKNGVFGIKGHCVTFPQDITQMCNELPQRRETLLTFVRNLGNENTSKMFPTRLTVNRFKVVRALKWLQKHNPFYKSVTIKDENFDWMEGKDEVNVSSDGVILEMKESSRTKMKENEDEYVSRAHCTIEDDDEEMTMRTVHANEKRSVPTGRQATPIKELIEVAQKTNQASKVMNFPPIDHDSAVS